MYNAENMRMVNKVYIKKIPGFPDYACDELGGVFSFKSGDIYLLKQAVGSRGYLKVTLTNGARDSARTMNVHRLIATTWIGPPPDAKAEVNHKNGNKQDNCVNNLEWSTRTENERHARRELGKDMRGEKHTGSKLTAEQVREMRELRAAGWTHKRLSARFGMGMSQINRIVRLQKWKHVV